MSRVVGNVKWYDTKKGYGFITYMTPGDDDTGKDIFIHFSNINVEEGYRRLFPGEYIEFERGEGSDGRSVCLNVSGLFGGGLLCQNERHGFKVFPKRPVEEDVEEAGTEAGAEAEAEAEDN